MRKRKNISTLILLLLLVIGILVILFFNKIALFLFPSQQDRAGELIKLILSVIGGLCLLHGLWISNRRAKATEESVKIQGQQINLSLKSQIDERFKIAVEHLGDEKEPVILGGIVELHQIAKEDKAKYAEVVFNILCSYIRRETSIYQKTAEDINSTAINTIINFIFRRYNDNPYHGFNADLSSSNLAGQDIIGCDFSNANLGFCYLGSIENTILDNADLSRAQIFAIKFNNNSLRGVNFFKTKIEYTKFNNIEFAGNERIEKKPNFIPHFISCRFENVSFDELHFFEAVFIECIFINCTFRNASILNSYFYGCGFINIDFSNADLISKIDFSASMFFNVQINCIATNSIFKGCKIEKSSDIFISLDEQLKKQKHSKINSSDISALDFYLKSCVFGELSDEDCEVIRNKHKEINVREKLPIGKK